VKIVQRLALRFVIVSALITGTIMVFVFILTRGFLHADFIDRLTQQSSLEVLHYATPHVKDVMPPGSFSLINPQTSIYSADRKLLYRQGSYVIPDTWIMFMKKNTLFNAERGEYTTVGRRHMVNDVLYFVFVSDKDLPGQRELNFLLQALIGGGITSLVLSYLMGLYYASNALKPVTRVVEEVKQINEDNLSYRLHVNADHSGLDEIGKLILTFNALLARIEKAFIAQKRFVQNASHELKTPLTAIMAEVELALARKRPPEEYQRTLEVVMLEAERLANITQGLLTLARLEESSSHAEMESINVVDLMEEILRTFALQHPNRKIIQIGEVPGVLIQGNQYLLQAALINILDNAYKYSKSKIHIKAEHTGTEVIITIEDHGIGIPADDLQRIRSPLFRAANVSAIPGVGLGLALVDRVVAVHRGRLEITSKEGEGTMCLIRLPVFKGLS
jgi:signal transduction histidine kinase